MSDKKWDSVNGNKPGRSDELIKRLTEERNELAAQVVIYDNAIRKFAETHKHVADTDQHVVDTSAFYELGKVLNSPHPAAARLMKELEALRLRKARSVVADKIINKNLKGTIIHYILHDDIQLEGQAAEAAREGVE